MNKEVIEILYDKEIKVEKIFSYNASTDWLIQDKDEAVYLLEGEAILEYDNYEKKLKKGDFVFIKKYEKHRVKSTSNNCQWLCVFI